MSLLWSLNEIAESASIEAPPASPEAPASLLSSTSLGKSGTGGGYGGKLVHLPLVRDIDSVCLGYVGASGSKVCLVENCGVQAHQHVKFSFEDKADALTFIKAGSPHTVWASPYVDVVSFGSALSAQRGSVIATNLPQRLLGRRCSTPLRRLLS
jgi:hypothetical protein